MLKYLALARMASTVGTGLCAAGPLPLIDLPLAGDLTNRGSLGGEAAVAEFAPGQGPTYDVSPFGLCVDSTAAARHGGEDES